MNSMIVVAILAICAISSTQAGAIGHGTIISGPSGIVTPAGPIGPHGLGLGYGYGGVALAGPALIAGPGLGYGYGSGLGYGGGAGAVGYGAGGGIVGYGAHGVAIKGPATVPAVISGPAGKIYAEGLYGVPTHYGHYY